MTIPEHDCADHLDVIDAEIDTVTGNTWKSLRCTSCGHRSHQCDQGGSDSLQPIPDTAVFYTDPGWEPSS
ncbi:hypothetical protein EV384_1878 [Micromonospora kangleipakensis]|uniref:Uncharacterized protein n=1 Tax=Micromonospora kangleipakensis TaxID=1077942 RepID=A0A4Q8B915_9ACTN|nr:hypothetical protein [Micromonospora kangleipakensis]RZU73473.1 hypothetical protein EV384_1878 [Micromonospora kangleipakensis]